MDTEVCPTADVHRVRRTVADHVLTPVPTQITAVLVATSVHQVRAACVEAVPA